MGNNGVAADRAHLDAGGERVSPQLGAPGAGCAAFAALPGDGAAAGVAGAAPFRIRLSSRESLRIVPPVPPGRPAATLRRSSCPFRPEREQLPLRARPLARAADRQFSRLRFLDPATPAGSRLVSTAV